MNEEQRESMGGPPAISNAAELARLRTENAELKSENANLLKQWNDLDHRNEQRHREWRAENSELCSRLRTSNAELAAANDRIARLETELRREQWDRKAARELLSKLSDEHGNLLNERDALRPDATAWRELVELYLNGLAMLSVQSPSEAGAKSIDITPDAVHVAWLRWLEGKEKTFCAFCRKPIRAGEAVRIGDRTFHDECLVSEDEITA